LSETIGISWSPDDLIGRITVGEKYWAAVEWSEKRQAWCIEDAEGQCLSHKESIHGQATSKKEAVELAYAMIRDGRMPSPEQAAEAHQQRVERKRQQPSALRRAAKRKERREAEHEAFVAKVNAEHRERKLPELWETLADTFDFADPELWKSNSFASLRPRLITHIEARIAEMESERLYHLHRHRFSSAESLSEIEAKLARARQILGTLLSGR
jgi:hypothetical protein